MTDKKMINKHITEYEKTWSIFTRLEAEDMVDLVYKKAVQYHDRGSSMGPPSDLTLDHKGARDIVGSTLVILLLS